MILASELLILNQRGFLPLEGEEEPAFLQRISNLSKVQNSGISSQTEECQKALLHCKRLFDVDPDWVSVIEQQKELMPWQGAVLWMQEDQKGNSIPLIQLSPRLKSSILSKWYAKEEVLAHELIHAVRMPLNSSRFEEIVAYQTSRNPVRRYLGPLFRHPFEVFILLAALIIGWIGLFWSISLFLWLPWTICFFAILRLFFSQRLFKRCSAKLALLLKDKTNALPLIARLTDREIAFFACSSQQEIRSYIIKTKETQLRWQILYLAYPIY